MLVGWSAERQRDELSPFPQQSCACGSRRKTGFNPVLPHSSPPTHTAVPPRNPGNDLSWGWKSNVGRLHMLCTEWCNTVLDTEAYGHKKPCMLQATAAVKCLRRHCPFGLLWFISEWVGSYCNIAHYCCVLKSLLPGFQEYLEVENGKMLVEAQMGIRSNSR